MGRRATRWLAGGVLAALLLALFFRGLDWAALAEVFRTARPWPLALAVVLTIVMYSLRSWRWGYLLQPLARVAFKDLFSATIVGFMTGLVIPRAGEVVRPFLVGRRYGLKVSAAFASIILERLIDLITVLVFLDLYLFVWPLPAAQTRGAFLHGLRVGGAVAGVGALAILALLIALHFFAERVLSMCDRVLARFPERLARPVSHGLRAFSDGLAVVQAPIGHLLVVAAQSVAIWLTIAVTFHLYNRAFGIDLPFHSVFLMLGFVTVGVAIPTPGMVGGFHEAYLLSLTLGFGVDKASAAAAGIAAHALSNLPVLLGGLALLPREGLTFGRVARMTEEKEETR